MSKEPSTNTMVNTNHNSSGPAEIELSSEDFHFVYHRNPNGFFSEGERPLRLIQEKPPLKTYTDVIYIPTSRTEKQWLGCLYDENLTRIEASLTRQDLSDRARNTDPVHLDLDIRTDELPVYDQPVLYLGFLQPHFGHFIFESLSYWWSLFEEIGDIDHYLIHADNPPLDLQRPYVKVMFGAMQIDDDSIVYFDKPTRLRKVVVPGSSFQIFSHILTSYRETLHKLAISLGAAESSKHTDRPLYLSRTLDTGGVRRYVGEEKVESFLKERGVRVLHAQKLPLHEQVKLVNEHSCIMGFQGSQLAITNLSLQPKTMIKFTDHRVWPDHLLIDKCFNHDSTYVKVCKKELSLREAYAIATQRLTGQRPKKGSFNRHHIVDYERTVAWLESSGLLS